MNNKENIPTQPQPAPQAPIIPVTPGEMIIKGE